MARYIYRKPFLTYIYLDISAYRDIEIPIPMLKSRASAKFARYRPGLHVAVGGRVRCCKRWDPIT